MLDQGQSAARRESVDSPLSWKALLPTSGESLANGRSIRRGGSEAARADSARMIRTTRERKHTANRGVFRKARDEEPQRYLHS